MHVWTYCDQVQGHGIQDGLATHFNDASTPIAATITTRLYSNYVPKRQMHDIYYLYLMVEFMQQEFQVF